LKNNCLSKFVYGIFIKYFHIMRIVPWCIVLVTFYVHVNEITAPGVKDHKREARAEA